MKSSAEFIAESYHANVDLIWNTLGRQHVTARFTIDTLQVVVAFEQRDAAGPWHIGFTADRGRETDLDLIQAAFQIFNGVFQAVREFATVREPKVLVIATRRERLAEIYEHYLRREESELNRLGCRLEGPVRVDSFQEFTLRPTTPPRWSSS